jgi:hypothetical protein
LAEAESREKHLASKLKFSQIGELSVDDCDEDKLGVIDLLAKEEELY